MAETAVTKQYKPGKVRKSTVLTGTVRSLLRRVGQQGFLDTNLVPDPPRDVPYYGNGILNFVFAMMWKRPGLSRRDRHFITFDEMREVVLQFAAHSGWPKASYLQQVTDELHARVLAEAATG